MSPLLALACAALCFCARAEDIPENNKACRKLIIGVTDKELTTEVKIPELHLKGPDDSLTIPNKIENGFALVGIKYVACDFLTGNKPTIVVDNSSALKAIMSCAKKKPRCRAGLEMQVTQYGVKTIMTPP